jgi:hypothetical protein
MWVAGAVAQDVVESWARCALVTEVSAGIFATIS